MGDLVSAISGSGQTTVTSGSDLVNQVARIVGGEDDPNVRRQALDVINRVRERMNRRLFKFTKTTASAITLVNNTQTYTLPTAFNRSSSAYLLDTNSKHSVDLLYRDDAWFNHQFPTQTSGGTPRFYQLRNAFGDGLIKVYPIPDTSAATSYTMVVEYFSRIGSIADSTDAITAIPEEGHGILVEGGQYMLACERRSKDAVLITQKKADYEQAWESLLNWDRDQSDEQVRFRMGPATNNIGTVYIKVT